MNTLDFKNQHLNDILFQNRNKSYGAYVLRKLYEGHVLKASLLASILFVSCFLLPKLFAKAANTVSTNKNVAIELLPPPPMNAATPVNGGCTEEAIRVVQGMPKWKPGKQQGRAVKVNFTLPIKFKLD
ncbi:MAG: hypothetical protein RIS64_2935 [Bacteroidota bacterium]|jgi:hypothetical protein